VNAEIVKTVDLLAVAERDACRALEDEAVRPAHMAGDALQPAAVVRDQHLEAAADSEERQAPLRGRPDQPMLEGVALGRGVRCVRKGGEVVTPGEDEPVHLERLQEALDIVDAIRQRDGEISEGRESPAPGLVEGIASLRVPLNDHPLCQS
jgi:hypothetical protein